MLLTPPRKSSSARDASLIALRLSLDRPEKGDHVPALLHIVHLKQHGMLHFPAIDLVKEGFGIRRYTRTKCRRSTRHCSWRGRRSCPRNIWRSRIRRPPSIRIFRANSVRSAATACRPRKRGRPCTDRTADLPASASAGSGAVRPRIPRSDQAERGEGKQKQSFHSILPSYPRDAAAGLVGIEGGAVTGVLNLESSAVEALDRRQRHGRQYQRSLPPHGPWPERSILATLRIKGNHRCIRTKTQRLLFVNRAGRFPPANRSR